MMIGYGFIGLYSNFNGIDCGCIFSIIKDRLSVYIKCKIPCRVINGVKKVTGFFPKNISFIDWIIPTIREHVVANDALAGGDKCVRVDEAANLGVIVAGL